MYVEIHTHRVLMKICILMCFSLLKPNLKSDFGYPHLGVAQPPTFGGQRSCPLWGLAQPLSRWGAMPPTNGRANPTLGAGAADPSPRREEGYPQARRMSLLVLWIQINNYIYQNLRDSGNKTIKCHGPDKIGNTSLGQKQRRKLS